MEVKIGDEEGVEACFFGDCIAVKNFNGGMLTPGEARQLAAILNLMADFLDREYPHGC